MKVLQRITYILIPTLLIAAYLLAKPHEWKPQANHDRLQWSGRAEQYKPVSVMPGNTEGTGSIDSDLLISAQSLDAGLQLSFKLKPFGDHMANPYGSGTLSIGANKYPFMADSKSALRLHDLKDGTVYVEGPIDATVNKSYGQVRIKLGIACLLDTGEASISYANPDGKTLILFGKGITSHADEIEKLPKSDK